MLTTMWRHSPSRDTRVRPSPRTLVPYRLNTSRLIETSPRDSRRTKYTPEATASPAVFRPFHIT